MGLDQEIIISSWKCIIEKRRNLVYSAFLKFYFIFFKDKQLYCFDTLKNLKPIKLLVIFSISELQLQVCVLCNMGEKLAGLHAIVIKLLNIAT